MEAGKYSCGEPEALTDENICRIFQDAGDFVRRPLQCGGNRLCAYFIDGLTAGGDIAEYILKPLFEHPAATMPQAYRQALDGGVFNATAAECPDPDAVAEKLVNGFCAVLFPGTGALAFEVKTTVIRSPAPPEVENTVKGPKDAFVETIRVNTSLVRRHLRTPDLRIYETVVGRRTLTRVSVIWIRGITNPDFPAQMIGRLNGIDVDGFLSPAAVEEYVTGSRTTAFPLIQYTERPDGFCQGLLDGRVGLLADGLPLGYLAPVNLGYFMESPEDRSRDYLTASCIRTLRYATLLVGLALPGGYIAAATFHQQLIPLPMLRSIIESKAAVPFPTTLEVIGLLIAFELLQESGVHLPQAIGQSVSVIGGIVVGTAAVEAGLISPVALIVVSIAGICGFVLPNRDLAEGLRVWRFVIVILSAIGGFYGTAAGILLLILHLLGLKSMGIPYLRVNPTDSIGGGILRKRLKHKKYRNRILHPEDRRNQK